MSANTLLIVEDSHIQAKIICQRFEARTSFTLLAAHSLAEAKNLADAHKDDLFAAVVDLNLPDAPDGETVDLLRAQGIPCIVLAATFDDKLRRGFLEKQVADYFLKGSIDDLDPLIDSVQRLHTNYGVKALIVDDSGAQRALVKHMLKIQCITSQEASDGTAALEVLKANPDIRLVITDFEMPRMNGIALVQEIRRTFRRSRMAVIGVSSAGSGPLTAQFLKHGANDFLTKPFEAEEFYWRVNQTLENLDVMEEVRAYRQQQV